MLLKAIMIPGLYKSAAGMMAQTENHQIISENLAAASVPGHRRNQASFEAYLPAAGAGDPKANPAQIKGLDLPQVRTSVDFTPGKVERDGNTFHFALTNTGFFAVELPNNRGVAYTRNGAFRLNEAGELTTFDGKRVLAEGGGPVVIPKPSSPVEVTEKGEVIQETNNLGKLQIANFSNPAKSLRWSGGGYFLPSSPSVRPDLEVENPGVRQGYMETSNVNPIHEMVALIEAMRSYEANQKVLAAQDNSLDQVIRQVPAR